MGLGANFGRNDRKTKTATLIFISGHDRAPRQGPVGPCCSRATPWCRCRHLCLMRAACADDGSGQGGPRRGPAFPFFHFSICFENSCRSAALPAIVVQKSGKSGKIENLPLVKLSRGSGGGPRRAPPGPPQGGPGGAPLFHFSIFPFVLRTIADRPPTGHSCSTKMEKWKTCPW